MCSSVTVPVGVAVMWKVILCALVAAATAAAREYTEDNHLRLPRLYHLDNYERCLAPKDGLYCMGTFRLSSNKSNAAYSFIKKYSSVDRHFDRTLLHRGYCLTSRCPSLESNTTLRFERCVEQHALPADFVASLQSISCNSNEDKNKEMDTPRRLFLYIIGSIFFANLLGTLYDVLSGENKNRLLVAWSIRENWRRLTTTHADGDPRLSALAPLQGIRVLLLALVMLIHAPQIRHKIYLYNPEFFEQALLYPITMLIRNGSSLVQHFIVVSNFLFAYSLLLYSKNRQLGLAQLPLCILHRIVRLAPVYLIVVGFAATWWPYTGNGPQWDVNVGAESNVCRKTFWTHALFINNLVHDEKYCLVPTWFLAVDMQLYIVAAVVMLYIIQKKIRPIPVLLALFFIACGLNASLAYYKEWKSMLYIMVPENIRTTFRGIPSFTQFYITPWGSLPACFLGLLTAHIHFNMQENGYKITKHRLFVWIVKLIVPLHVAWIMAGNALLKHTTRYAITAYIAIERPGFALLASIALLGIANNVDDWFRRLMAWHGWTALGRASLSVLMLHWLINMRLVATQRTLFEASFFSICGDWLSTALWTVIMAIPMTLLVEAPIQRTFIALVS